MLYAKHLSSTEHTLLVQVVTTLNELFQRRDAMVIDQVHCVRTKVWPFTFFPFSLPPLRLLFLCFGVTVTVVALLDELFHMLS